MTAARPTNAALAAAFFVLAPALLAPRGAQAGDTAALVKVEVLHSFDGEDGAYPEHSLIMGQDGEVHGTATTSFRITREGVFTVVNAFDKRINGNWAKGLVQAADGQYYGAAYIGGNFKHGTAYRMSRGGKVTKLHDFNLASATGGYPRAPFLQARDGAFYSTTTRGDGDTCGSLFRMTPEGAVTSLHTFLAQPDNGCSGFTWALMQASDGHIYGTTEYAGAHEGGTLYRWTPDGTWQLLHSFGETADHGKTPSSGLAQGPDGQLYGVTKGGGHGTGTIYRFDPATGTVTTLHRFPSRLDDPLGPSEPRGELVLASDGHFYGVTLQGGEHQSGTVFRLSISGEVTTLYSFPDQAEGKGFMPFAGLVEGRDGEFFGTTHYGGKFNRGIVYRLKLK